MGPPVCPVADPSAKVYSQAAAEHRPIGSNAAIVAADTNGDSDAQSPRSARAPRAIAYSCPVTIAREFRSRHVPVARDTSPRRRPRTPAGRQFRVCARVQHIRFFQIFFPHNPRPVVRPSCGNMIRLASWTATLSGADHAQNCSGDGDRSSHCLRRGDRDFRTPHPCTPPAGRSAAAAPGVLSPPASADRRPCHLFSGMPDF